MSGNQEIVVGPELSLEFRNFQEFCGDNSGQELLYLEVVRNNPREMDPVTLAFSLRHLLRLSGPLMNVLLESLNADSSPDMKAVLATKGIQLDKARATELRDIVFAFRDEADPERQHSFVRALQLMTMSRNSQNLVLSLEEEYMPPEEGWTSEDFGDDESLFETVRAIEDPYWIKTEET
jgi:hypothetical protein